MKIKDLRPNKRNPRKISDKKLEALKESVIKFGDLGCFVWNKRTKQLVSGHQRCKTIPADATIKIENKFEKPTSSYTVAEGYVLIGDEKFKYREVDAPEDWEVEAMIAANKHSGDWDSELLKNIFVDFPQLNWKKAGFELPELKLFGIDAKNRPGDILDDDEEQESDEEYIKGTPETFEQIDQQRIPPQTEYVNTEEKNPFDEVQEVTEAVGKKIVIIISCPSQKVKDQLKEKLRPAIEESGAALF